MTDSRNEGGLLAAGLLQLLLMALPLGDITTKAQQAQSFAPRIKKGDLAHLEAGRMTIGIGHPLLVGTGDVARVNLLVSFKDFGGDLG